MLNIPATIQTLFKTDGVRKNFRVHFPNGELPDITNENVMQESVKFTESICSQDVFKFGLAEESVIEFETVGVPNMYGMTIECGIEIDTSSLSAAQISAITGDPGDGVLVLAADSDIGYGFYRVPLGTFQVDSCPRNHQAMTHRSVTAYTVMFKNNALNFPTEMPFSKIFSYKSAIDALAAENLTKVASYGFDSRFPAGYKYLFDSAGVAFYINLNPGDSAMSTNTIDPVDGVYPAFLKATMPGYDPVAYEAFGVVVANTITAAGLDLTYNSSGQKIFPNNEAALRSCYPMLFSPVVVSVYDMKQNGSYSFIRGFRQAVGDGEYIPVISSTGHMTNTPAFYVQEGKYRGAYSACSFCYVYTDQPALTLQIVNRDTGTTTDRTIPSDGVLTTPATLDAYTVPSLDTQIVIPNSGSAYVNAVDMQSVKTLKAKAYSFDPLPLAEISASSLEISGEFLKPTRDGGADITSLDPSSPISISTDDFHGGEMWWDEFSVSPIGSVIATFGNNDDGEATVEIPIGPGASVYDMSDNEMLKLVQMSTVEDVAVLLSTLFSANAANVAFTPTDLTMQGWPWMEAGDALEVTTEDLTVVNTYALRIEMSGIQRLTSVITAQGGEIIGEV